MDRTPPRKASAKCSNHSVIFKLLARGGHNRRSASSSVAKATPNCLAVSRDAMSAFGGIADIDRRNPERKAARPVFFLNQISVARL
jgi:hypothetical protein